MNTRWIAWTLAFALLLGAGLSAAGAQEQVVSLSYLNKTVQPELADAVTARVAQMIESPDAVTARGQAAVSAVSKNGAIDSVARRVLERLQMQGLYLNQTTGARAVTLKKDDVISGAAGTTLLLRRGSGTVINHPLVNITRGELSGAGSAAAQNTRYLLPSGNGAGIRVTSNTAEVLVDGAYRVVSVRYRAQYFDLADALKTMDLFRGSNIGYELSRSATRTEALVMLLRLLGEEDAAKAYTGALPFQDVDAWARPYVAYAAARGYTRGVSATQFGGKNPVSANQYMTFLLRALGYDDTKGDFRWDHAMEFAVSKGNLSQTTRTAVEKAGFHRDQMVLLSYATLFAKRNGGEQTLLETLIASGAVDKKAADAAVQGVTRPDL